MGLLCDVDDNRVGLRVLSPIWRNARPQSPIFGDKIVKRLRDGRIIFTSSFYAKENNSSCYTVYLQPESIPFKECCTVPHTSWGWYSKRQSSPYPPGWELLQILETRDFQSSSIPSQFLCRPRRPCAVPRQYTIGPRCILFWQQFQSELDVLELKIGRIIYWITWYRSIKRNKCNLQIT